MMGQQETVAEQAGGALRRIVLALTVGVFMAAIIIDSTLPALALTEYRAKFGNAWYSVACRANFVPGDPDDGTLAECECGLYQLVNKGPLLAGVEPDFYIQCPKRGDLGSCGFGGNPECKTHLEPVPATP